MTTRLIALILLPLVLGAGGCDKKAETTDVPAGGIAVSDPQRSCTHLIAKLGSCSRAHELNQRFAFDRVKDWVYEDCEKLKTENRSLFDRLMSCVNTDCPQMESCLEEVLGKWQENRK